MRYENDGTLNEMSKRSLFCNDRRSTLGLLLAKRERVMHTSAAFPVLVLGSLFGGICCVHAQVSEPLQFGPRPLSLVEDMDEGPLKAVLQGCATQVPRRTAFSIGHRGAPWQYPEHTQESYEAGARMGAGILECDVTFTKDRELVCRHSQCDLHTTTNILAIPELAAQCAVPFTPANPQTGTPAAARCCTSDVTLEEFLTLRGKMDTFNPKAVTVEEYVQGPPGSRTDSSLGGTLLTHAQSIALFERLGVKFVPELKAASVPMPYEGEYTQQAYAQQMIDEYKAAGIPPSDVFVQSFSLDDLRYWIANEPAFGQQAVFLDDRVDREGGVARAVAGMNELVAQGVHIVAPPMWVLLKLDALNRVVPSEYARAARAAGLHVIPWTLERSGPLGAAKGPPPTYYYQSIAAAIDNDGDLYEVLDVLARQVGIRAIFSDWPATVTYYANCMGLN